MKSIWDHKFSLLALVGIGLGLFLSKGGVAAALMPLGRILLPVLAVFFLFSLVKKKLTSVVGGGLQKRMQDAMEEMQRRQASAGGADTIDLCSKCGNVKQAGHVCK